MAETDWKTFHRQRVHRQLALRLPTPKESLLLPPPKVAPRPYSFQNPRGDTWSDDFRWLHDKADESVLEYIAKENSYTESCLAPILPLQKQLFKEFISRHDESEQSAHVTLPDGWTYYSRRVKGEEYRQHCRIHKRSGLAEVYLDENEIAMMPEFANATYFYLGFLRHSPCGRYIAFGVDANGSEQYSIFIKDLQIHVLLPDRLKGCWEDFEFSNDGNWAYYLALDECDRADRLFRHRVGTPDASHDVVLYQEMDEMFFLSLSKSCNSQVLLLNSSAQVTSETHYLYLEEEAKGDVWEYHSEGASNWTMKTETAKGLAPCKCIFPRREGVQYTVESHQDHFYILTNEGKQKNNWLFRIPRGLSPSEVSDSLLELRETVIPPRDFVLIEDFQVRIRHLVVFERSNCLQNVRIVDLTDSTFTNFHYISFSEPVYSLWPMTVSEEIADLSKHVLFNTNVLRYTYTSFLQPKQIVDYDMETRSFSIVHTERVNGAFAYNPELYVARRLFAIGEDGTAIPLSIVHRKDLLGVPLPTSTLPDRNGDPQAPSEHVPNPLLLHAYGAYGSCVNPMFSTQRLSLLDRGFVYAIAHVRGGSDLGMSWYEEGKSTKKTNSIKDFIRCMDYLIQEGYTSPSKLAIYGRSAGGLLMGAVTNKVPHLIRAVLTEVPFVDVINTMFDASIPWTAFEWEEWGSPIESKEYVSTTLRKAYTVYL
jgi:oligopeptidase B